MHPPRDLFESSLDSFFLKKKFKRKEILFVEMIADLGKFFVPVAIFFVWVIRYDNIIKEFEQYSLPDGLRDFVGILKLSFVLMIATSDGYLLKIGAGGIAILMFAALLVHLKVKNPLSKMLPAMTLMILSLIIFTQAM